ncbi:MAG: hypothetical protein ACP5UO_03715 [Thermoplasmata archaeon]
MKSLMRSKEEGVATAIGAILSILIVVLLLSLFVASYLPAEMSAYEESYSNNLLKSVMEVDSSINLLYVTFNKGEVVSVPFSMESGNVPLLSSPTVGTLSLMPADNGFGGFISVSNLTTKVSAGGSLSVETNDRYYVDQVYYYELSSVESSQIVNGSLVGSVMEFGLLSVQNGSNGSVIISLHLVNLEGGPVSISSPGPISVTLEAVSESEYRLTGNLSIAIDSQFSSQLFSTISDSLSHYSGISVQHSISGDNLVLSISPGGSVVIADVSELTVFAVIGA